MLKFFLFLKAAPDSLISSNGCTGWMGFGLTVNRFDKAPVRFERLAAGLCCCWCWCWCWPPVDSWDAIPQQFFASGAKRRISCYLQPFLWRAVITITAILPSPLRTWKIFLCILCWHRTHEKPPSRVKNVHFYLLRSFLVVYITFSLSLSPAHHLVGVPVLTVNTRSPYISESSNMKLFCLMECAHTS